VTQQVLTDNVSDAELLGLELDASLNLPRQINVRANLLVLDSSFEDSAVLDPRTSSNEFISVDGNQLPNVSRWNLNLRLSQNLDFTLGPIQSADWTVNILYRSEFFLTPFNNKGYMLDDNGNTVEIPLASLVPPANNGALAGVGGEAGSMFYSDVVDDVIIVNLNAGVNFGDTQQYRVDAYVENAFEQAYSTKAFVNTSVNIRYLNAPRIFGIRFRAFFD
jgi:iron complex outermembrane receptor protein